MVDTYSISLEGFQNAERDLELAARKIASPNLSVRSVPARVSDGATGQTFPLHPTVPTSTAASPDYVVELLSVRRSKTAAEANLKTFSLEEELERETLDLLG